VSRKIVGEVSDHQQNKWDQAGQVNEYLEAGKVNFQGVLSKTGLLLQASCLF
ncbi:MAG: hypothetical protein HGA53_05455, partial [Anaerolineaceae bacterium]|nr:hypothetical protein [Anaerolineaceae bacterium]